VCVLLCVYQSIDYFVDFSFSEMLLMVAREFWTSYFFNQSQWVKKESENTLKLFISVLLLPLIDLINDSLLCYKNPSQETTRKELR